VADVVTERQATMSQVPTAWPNASSACRPGSSTPFSNPGEAPVRFLNFNTPAGWEGYMRELAAAASEGRAPSPEEMGRIASNYDFRPI